MSEEEKSGAEGAQGDTPETQASAPSATQPALAPSSPGRLARWSSTALRWVTALGVVFGLGVALVWFIRVLPQTQELRQLNLNLADTRQQLATAQAETESLKPLKDENAKLNDQLALSKQHLVLLSVLVDVSSAQLALAEDDPLAAQAALTDTDSKLGDFQSGLNSDPANAVKSMRDRLTTAKNELKANDLFAAKRDLEVIANTLVDLEGSLFSSSTP
jgi:hypothetical protein